MTEEQAKEIFGDEPFGMDICYWPQRMFHELMMAELEEQRKRIEDQIRMRSRMKSPFSRLLPP